MGYVPWASGGGASGGGGSSSGGGRGYVPWASGGGSAAPKKGFWDKGIPSLGKGLLSKVNTALTVAGNASPGLIEFTRRGFKPTPGQTAGDVLLGKGEARDLNMRKAWTGNAHMGGNGWTGKLAGLGDTIATQLLDPTTWVTFGASSLAKLGTKTAAKTLGKETAEGIAKVGAKRALSTADRLTLRTALAGAEGGSEKSAAKVLRALDRSGQGGLKLGDRTLIAGKRFTPVTAPVAAAKTKALESVVGKALVPRAGITTAEGLGKDVADDVGAVFARGRSAATRLPAEASDEMFKAARQAKVTKAELRDIVGPALEHGGRAERVAAALPKLVPFEQAPAELKLLKQAEELAPKANPFEQAARTEKATKLADALRKHGATADTARQLSGMEWAKVARVAGTNNPSATTRDLAASLLEKGAQARPALKVVPAAEEAAARAAPKAGKGDPLFSQMSRKDRKALAAEVHEAAKAQRVMDRAAAAPVGEKAAPLATQAAQATAVPPRLQPLVDLQAAKLAEGSQRRAAAGLFPAAGQAEGELPRVLTAKGKKALEDSPIAAERHFGTPLTGSATTAGVLPRHFLEGKTSAEVEALVGDELRKAGRLKGDLLEHNPLVRTAHTVARDERAVANRNAITELSKIRDPEGNPILSLADEVTSGAAKRPAGATEFELPGVGLVAAHPEVAKEVKRATAAISQPETMREFQGLLGHLNSLWKGYATVPVIGGFGFHMRNATGNVWNNFLAGVKNPADYSRATRIQHALHKAEGDVAKLAAPDRKLVEMAQRHGVLNDGFFITELTDPRQAGGKLGRAATGNRVKRVTHGLDPLSLDNYAIRSGRSIGSAVENNARLAHFVSKLRTLGSADEAARSVRKYLFDYGDLTDSERGLKKVAAFYTFTRKNVPLQIAEMARQPGKFTALARLQRNMMIDAPEGSYPQWALDDGMIPVNGGKTMVGIDLPATAAAKALDPGNALDQLGGLMPSVAKWMAENRTGKNLFTGGNLKGSKQRRLAEAVMPLIGKVERSPMVSKATGDPQTGARTLSALTGLQARTVTPGDRKSAEYKKFRAEALRLGGREVTIIAGPKGGEASPELKALLRPRQQEAARKAAETRKAKGATKKPAGGSSGGGYVPWASASGR